jgi:hypothetical protein
MPTWTNSVMTAIRKVFPYASSSGSGTQTAYSVEARATAGPMNVCGNLIGDDWVRLSFKKDPTNRRPGVPSPGCFDMSGQMENHDLYSYAAAESLRWWIHALDNSAFIQTRIVKHEIKYKFDITVVGAGAVIDGLDDRHMSKDEMIEPAEEAPETAEST